MRSRSLSRWSLPWVALAATLVHCQALEPAPPTGTQQSSLGLINPPPLIPWGEPIAMTGVRFDDPGASFPHRYHTFVAQLSGAIKQIAWAPLHATTVSDVADFYTAALAALSPYAGETGATRHIVVAESDGDVYELRTTKDSAATATYVGWFGWMVPGGTVRSATGFVQDGVRYVALLWDSGDITWLSRGDWSTGLLMNGLYSATHLTAYPGRDGKPRLVVGPYWGSGYWTLGGSDLRTRTTLRMKYIASFDNVVAVSAHFSPETGAHVVLAASDGTLHEAHLNDSDELTAAVGNPERAWATGAGEVRGLASYMVGGLRQHVLVANRAGELRLYATADGQPRDDLILDRINPWNGTDDRRCLPGGQDYFYVNIERTSTSFPDNTVIVPEQGTLTYSVSRGGPATSGVVTIDGVDRTVALGGAEETPVPSAIQVSSYNDNLNHRIRVVGACGAVERSFTALRYPSAPSFDWVRFNVGEPPDRTYARLPRGSTATPEWQVAPAPARCGTQRLTIVGRTDQGTETFRHTASPPNNWGSFGSTYHIFPNANTTYTLTVSCSESGLATSRTLRFEVYDRAPDIYAWLEPADNNNTRDFATIPVGGEVKLHWGITYYVNCASARPKVIIEGRNRGLAGQTTQRFYEELMPHASYDTGTSQSAGVETFKVSLDTDTYFTVKTICPESGLVSESRTLQVRLYAQAPTSQNCQLECYKISSSVSGLCTLYQWCVPENISDPLQVMQSFYPSATVTETSECFNYAICS